MEREFIRRRPGQYPQAWLAPRLGVSTRSLYNYHRAEGIIAEPCFLTTPLDWRNYERLLPTPEQARRMGLDTRGRFIEDEAGKRYPASVGIAQKLMSQAHCLVLRQRTFSTYQYKPVAAATKSHATNPRPIRIAEVPASIPGMGRQLTDHVGSIVLDYR